MLKKEIKKALKICYENIKISVKKGDNYAYLPNEHYVYGPGHDYWDAYDFSNECIDEVIKHLRHNLKLIVEDYRTHKKDDLETYFKISW